ncbi:MAG: hypothetical protein C4518_01485 [Desulfobacteraceae bacterium]|nr:MAG: hypothetical protein C4518_01485 [Desulfobacteraceae bacterium]
MGTPDRSKDGSGIFYFRTPDRASPDGGVFCLGTTITLYERQKKEANMYLYWRVQQDLNCLGETIIFHEPSLIRSLRQWVRKNAAGIALSGDFSPAEPVRPCMN